MFLVASLFSLVTLPVRRLPRAQGWVDVASDIFNVPVARSIFGVVLLFLLTGALLRRKRFAMWIVVAVQATGVVYAAATANQAVSLYRIRVLAGLPGAVGDQIAAYLGGVFGIAAIACLVWSRPAFPARRSPGSFGAAALTLAVGMIFSVAVAIALAEIFGPPSTHRWDSVILGLRAALDLDALVPPRPAAPHLPPWADTATSALSAVVVIAAVAVFLRSGRRLRPPDPHTELAVRTLLATGGHQDSLGYFATRRDKSIVSGADGRAAIGYRVIASVSLAAADPVGDPAAWPAAIDSWLTEARTYGWVPAALSPGREAAQAFVDAGLRAIPLGDEAIIDAAGFSLAGPAMKAVRQAVVRLQRSGYTVSIRRHRDIDAAEMSRIAALAEQWRGDAPERGFSMALSRLGDPVDGGCVLVLAHRPDGVPAGILSLVPWGAGGVSLDLMRRDRTSANGVVELMVTTLIERSGEFGVHRISLNFAMFRAVFAAADEFGAGPVTRLNNAVLGVFSRFFQLESLYRSNAKYQPRWVTRYLCIDSILSLPRVAIAAGIAEGFLPQPQRTAGFTSPAWLVSAVADLQDAAPVPRPAAPASRPEQERIRRARLAALAAAGMTGYPVSTPRTGALPDVLGRPNGAVVSVAGRVERLRNLGGVAFATLVADGRHLQLLLDRSEVGVEPLVLWHRTVDRGDIISATGVLGHSKSGERSLIVTQWTMAAKSLRPLPRTGVTPANPEKRARDRSAELITDRHAASMIVTRATAVTALRTAFRGRGFLEVETPVLQPVHGGATARPFTTQFHA